MTLYQGLDLFKLRSTIPIVSSQLDIWLQPELGFSIFRYHMNMHSRFFPREKEESDLMLLDSQGFSIGTRHTKAGTLAGWAKRSVTTSKTPPPMTKLPPATDTSMMGTA
jgi:hypothetical protein